MKEFQTVVQELLHNHERQRRYVAFLTALCMLMAFTVSMILVEPAESLTGELVCTKEEHIHSEECFTYTCGLENDENHQHSEECRELTCGKPEHTHSGECFSKPEEEPTAQIMQINEPASFDEPVTIADGLPDEVSDVDEVPESETTEDDTSADDSSEDENIAPQSDNVQPRATVNEKTSFDSAPANESELSENAREIQSNEITISDLTIDGAKVEGENNQYHYKTDKDKVPVEFNLKYYISGVSDFSGYLYYQLPEGIVPENGFYGSGKVVLGDSQEEIGHFAINENGFVSIHFNQTFIDKVNTGDGTIDGYVKFEGSVSRDKTSDGNRDLQIGKDEIIIDFPDKSFSVTKSGQAVAPETVGGNPKVKWTITVHDLAKRDDSNVLDNYYLYDELFEGAENVEITLDDSYTHSENAVTYDETEKRYKFSGNFEGDVTFTFEKELTDAEYNEFVAGKTTTKNNVYLKDKEDKTVSEDEATVTFENKVTMQKAGTADYVGGYIQWTVDVSRTLNQSLNGYKVQDDAIKVSDDIVVTSGDRTLTTDTDYTLDKEKGTITFNKDVADVKITYKQKRDTFQNQLDKENVSGNIQNSATLIPPEGKPTAEKNPVESNVKWEEPLKLTKSGKYDRFNDKIDWTITATGSSSYLLDNYVIEDDSLKNIKLKDINFEAKSDWVGLEVLTNPINDDTTEIILGTDDYGGRVEFAKIVKNGNKLTITTIEHTGPNYSAQQGVSKLTITYSTPVTPEMKQDANGTDESKKVVTNTVTDSKGHEVTGTVGIEPESTVTKILNGETSKIEYNKDTKTETLNWQIDLTQDLGFDDRELTDVMVVADNNELSHYITKDQRGEISIQYENSDGSFTDLPTDDYKITFYKSETDVTNTEDNATEFKITFKGDNASKYRHIRITYETTADITELTEDAGTAKFQNSATFDEKTETSTYTVERKDPNKVPTHKLTVTKEWAKNITDKSEIKFYLQRTLDNPITESTTWETYKKGGTWVSGVTDFSDDYLTALNSDSSWTATFENLEEHEMGKPESKYTYRVTEVLTKAQEGIFESTYENNDCNLTGDGQITITNKKKPDFVKSVDIEGAEDGKISVDKLLSDDEYYYIPYKITLSDFPKDKNVLITDIIPAGFELAYTEGFSEWSNVKYDVNVHHPYVQDNDNASNNAYISLNLNISEENPGNNNRNFNYVVYSDTHKALFCNRPVDELRYQIKIKKSDLKEKLSGGNEFTITNTATVGEKTKPVKVTITGEVEQTTPEDETLLKKDVLRPEGSTQEYIKSNNGVIEYYVYVNPDGRKLSNTDYFDVVDDFTLNSMTSGSTEYTADQLREMLETGLLEIKVEEISDFKQDSDGNITYSKGGAINNFTYTVEENPHTTNKQDISESFSISSNQECHIDNLNSGDKVIVEVATSGENPDFSQIHYRWQSGYIEGTSLEVHKTDGKNIAELTVPDGATCLYLNNWGKNGLGTVSCILTVKDKMVTTYESSSRLTINVPDETPLKITYRYEVTQDGGILPDKADFNASNKVSIATENASSIDELRDVTFRVNQAEAGATTGGNPSIRKFNVGTNKEVTGAKFYIARYDDDGWHFVKEVTETTGDKDKTLHELKYSETGITGEGLPDSGVAYIDLSTTAKYELTGSSLQSGILYKIIEVKAPSGYQGEGDIGKEIFGAGKDYDSLETLLKAYLANSTSIDTDYRNFAEKFVAVHYFKYGTTASTEIKKPANFKGNIMDVKSGGTISIPNNELINIKATKTWVGNEGTSVTFELLWSTKKQSSGIPDDATAVTAEALGLIGSFTNEKTVTGDQVATWENLPNGLNDRPVYYYVRETSYTTSEGTFERQTDGTYKLQNGDTLGTYKPTYTGNGLNKDGTVTVTNSNGLVIQKTWLKSDKTPMEDGEIPADKIKCNIYGKVNSNSEKVLIEKDLILEKEHDWKYTPTDLSKYSQYDYIIIEETEVHLTTDSDSDKWTSVDVALYGYVRSSTSNVTDGVGTATLINKDNTPTDVDVSVEKVWSDGNDKHSGDSITVKLYKSDTAISDADLANITNPESDSRLEVVTGEGITNPVTLDNSNNWKHTWNDLTFKGEGVSKYYYYAIETSVPTGYTASYFVNGNKTTITNSVPGSLTIDKKWLSTDGKDIISEITDKANFKLYRRANSSAAADDSKTLDGLKIFAFGDSITNGVGLDNSANERYSTLLQEKLKANGTNITVDNNSQSGYKIGQIQKEVIETAYPALNDDYGVVIVMAGTNNILNTTDDIDTTMKDEMSSLLNTIYSKDKNPNLVVFLEKIPRIIVEYDTDRPGNRADTFSSLTLKQKQEKWDDLVTSYNNMLVQLASEYSGTNKKPIIVVDTYTAVGENFYRDSYAKIHPDKVGHQKIAELLYDEILKYYGIEGSKAPVGVNGLPSDFYKNGSVNPLYEEVNEFTLPDNGSWSKTFTNLDTKKDGNDYVYYIVEETTGNWTAAYTGNGQIIGNEGATITVTNTIDKGSIEVEKVWKNHTPSDMDKVEVQLYRSTTKPESELRTSSIMNEPMTLADDGIMLTSFEQTATNKGILTIDENGEKDDNKLKYAVPTGGYSGGGWIKLKVSDSMKDKKVSSIEFPNGSDWISLNFTGYDNGHTPEKITISPAKTLNELVKYDEYENGSGFSGTFGEGAYFIITLADDGGTTTPPQTHGDTELTFESGVGTTKIAEITGANIGDKIIVHLAKDAITVGANGCFGYSTNDSTHENWCNYTWNYNNNVIAGIATVDVAVVDSQVEIGTDGDDITFTWTVPEDYNTSGIIQFQIWGGYIESNLSSATYTISSSTTTETVDPEPIDDHIPTGAVAVGDPVELKTNHWKHTFTDLPLTDANGTPYYYYVKEVTVPNGFEVTYSDGVTPDGTIIITNTKKESSTTTMPSTGGNGARKYYTVGGMLMLLSACGWAMRRRRRVIPH